MIKIYFFEIPKYQEKIKATFNNTMKSNTNSFLDNLFYEIASSTTSGFIFSLPTSLFLILFGISYSAFSTFYSFTFSTISCAFSNNLLTSPNNKSFSSKIISYLINYIVALSSIKSFSFHSLTEVVLNIKKASFVISFVFSIDHITKSLIELSFDDPFKYLDSFLGFDRNIDSNNPEL